MQRKFVWGRSKIWLGRRHELSAGRLPGDFL